MRSQRKRTIEVLKNPNFGRLPSYIGLAQRHFEKGKVEGETVVVGGKATSARKFVIPLDLLRLNIPSDLVEEIESVEVVYGK